MATIEFYSQQLKKKLRLYMYKKKRRWDRGWGGITVSKLFRFRSIGKAVSFVEMKMLVSYAEITSNILLTNNQNKVAFPP